MGFWEPLSTRPLHKSHSKDFSPLWTMSKSLFFAISSFKNHKNYLKIWFESKKIFVKHLCLLVVDGYWNSFSSSWTDAIWAFKLSFWVNLDLHKSHSKDFSPSWFKWICLHDLYSYSIELFLVHFWGIIKDFFLLMDFREYIWWMIEKHILAFINFLIVEKSVYFLCT